MNISVKTIGRVLLSFITGLFLAWGFAAFSSQAWVITASGHPDAASLTKVEQEEVGDRQSLPSQAAFRRLPENLNGAQSAEQVSSDLAKSIAIDAAPHDAGPSPNVVQMDDVHLAAQVWASASFPVESFQAYTSPFGYRSSPTGGYGKEFHYGLDIAAPANSYIRNWWAGTVIDVSDGGNCGTSVVIKSGEWTHMYCHMQGHVEYSGQTPYLVDLDGGVQLHQGQHIAAGARIGRVGMTGRTTGPHLHWGLKYQGNWVDPAWVLQAMAASYQALYGQ